MNIIKSFLLLLCVLSGIACASQDQSPKLGVKHARSEEVGGAAGEEESPAKKAKTAAAISDDSMTAQATAQYNAALLAAFMTKMDGEGAIFCSKDSCVGASELKSTAELGAGAAATCAMPSTSQPNMSNANKKGHKCDVCGKILAKADILVTHMKRHTLGKIFKCALCGYSAYQKHNLQNHYGSLSHEKAVRLWKRTKQSEGNGGGGGGANSITDAELESKIDEIEERGLNPFECNTCPTRWGSQNALDLHARSHTGDQKIECTVCKKSFYNVNELTSHYKTAKHKNKLKEISSENPGGDGGGAAPMVVDFLPVAAAAATSITSGFELKRLAELPAASVSLPAALATVPSVAAAATPVAMAAMRANMPDDPMIDVGEAKDPAAFAMPLSLSDSAAIVPMAPFVPGLSLNDLMLKDDGLLGLPGAAASSDLSALANDLFNGDL